MKKANKLQASIAVIIGEDEIKNNKFSIKDLETGEQNIFGKKK